MTGEDISQAVGVAVVALAGVAVGLQKILKGWKEDSTGSSIMSLMHEELNRLSAQNRTLSEELNKFQLEVVKLNNQLTDLTVDNHRLRNEVVILTKEVTSLQKLMEESPDHVKKHFRGLKQVRTIQTNQESI